MIDFMGWLVCFTDVLAEGNAKGLGSKIPKLYRIAEA